MLKRIKSFVNNTADDKKRLLSNFISLAALQGINMILPLLTLPYLVRVLGIEKFGLINFVLSIIMYFSIIVSFGFELSATREISIHRDDKDKVSEIFSAVMIIKSLLAILSFIVLIILVLCVEIVNDYAMLYYVTFGIVLGNVIFPSWFFQGMERMKYITYINVATRVIFTSLIFVFVHNESDYIYVPLFNSLGSITGGVYSLWLLFKIFPVKFCLPNKSILLRHLKASFHFFLSRIANSGSRYYATSIIGIYFGTLAVGYYAMVEKLFYAFMSLGGIVSQTIYPYMSRTKNIIFFKKIFLVITSISIIILVPTMYFNEVLLNFVFNVSNEMLSKLFLIVFSGALFGVMSALVGYPLLAAFGFVRHANNSLVFASIKYTVCITLSAILLNNIYFVAMSLVVYEVSGLMLRLYYIKKEQLLNN